MSTCTNVTFVLVGPIIVEHLVEHRPAVLRRAQRRRREQHRHRLPGADHVGRATRCAAGHSASRCRSVDAERVGLGRRLPHEAPPAPGTGATASAGSVMVNPLSCRSKLGLAVPDAGLPEGGLGRGTRRGPWAARRWSSASGERVRQSPPGGLGTAPDRRPAHVLDAAGRSCCSTSVKRCGSRRRVEVGREGDRLRLRRLARRRTRGAHRCPRRTTPPAAARPAPSNARRETRAVEERIIEGHRPLSCLLVTATGDRVGVHVQRRIGRRGSGARRVAALGAPRASRDRLGEGRVRAAGAVRVLHGARRRRTAGRVRDAGDTGRGSMRSPRSKVSMPRDTRRAGRRVRRPRRLAMRLLHPRDPRARRRRCRRRGRAPADRPRPGARRPPVPLHRLADDLRGARRRRRAGLRGQRCPDDAAARRRRGGAAGRARRRGAAAVGAAIPLGEAGSPTTPRPATRWSRCRCRPGSSAPSTEAAGDAVGGGRVAVTRRRTLAAQGAGPADHRRRHVAPAGAPAACRRRCAPRHRMGRARVPRARRVVVRAGRDAGVAARERRRVRRQGVARWSPPPPASSPTATGRTVRVLFSREDVVRLGPKRPPIAATRSRRRRSRRRAAAWWPDPSTPVRPAHRLAVPRRAMAGPGSGSRYRRPTDRDAPPRGRARRHGWCCSRAR